MDSYRIIAAPSEGQYTEKRSRFLAFARPIASEEEARAIVKDFQNRYHDARHVCFAYVLGTDAEVFRANDGGEPSGTAGRPILGQIRSLELTNVLVVVVRYFGGIQLGAANLGVAYKTAARAALDAAEVREEYCAPKASRRSALRRRGCRDANAEKAERATAGTGIYGHFEHSDGRNSAK